MWLTLRHLWGGTISGMTQRITAVSLPSPVACRLSDTSKRVCFRAGCRPPTPPFYLSHSNLGSWASCIFGFCRIWFHSRLSALSLMRLFTSLQPQSHKQLTRRTLADTRQKLSNQKSDSLLIEASTPCRARRRSPSWAWLMMAPHSSTTHDENLRAGATSPFSNLSSTFRGSS